MNQKISIFEILIILLEVQVFGASPTPNSGAHWDVPNERQPSPGLSERSRQHSCALHNERESYLGNSRP